MLLLVIIFTHIDQNLFKNALNQQMKVIEPMLKNCFRNVSYKNVPQNVPQNHKFLE